MTTILMPLETITVAAALYPAMAGGGPISERYCYILNEEDVFQAGISHDTPRQLPFPVAQLQVTAESFEADYFIWEGYQFVSERLREAMALDPSEVRYFDIDDSTSAAATRAKNFKIMEPLAVEDVSDRSRTRYEMRRLMPGDPERPNALSDVVMRDDAQPEHPLFFEAFFGRLYCTEAFALRVLRAGCTGMKFVYLERRLADPHFRTLRGVEQYVRWDAKKKVEITRLVRAIG